MFVGHEKEFDQVFAALSRKRPRVIAVRGPSGRGKTEFLKEAVRKLRSETPQTGYSFPSLQNADLLCGLHESEGTFEDWAFPYLNVLRQIVAAIAETGASGPRLGWFAKALRNTFQSNMGKIAGAIVQDVVDKGLPKTAATVSELLVEGLKSISIEKTLEDLVGEHRESVMAGYTYLLSQVNNTAPPALRFVLLFDNVQIAGENFCSALKHLARNVPERFYVVYAFNDETEEGRRFETRHWPDLKAIGQLEIAVPRMTPSELRRWIEAAKGPSPHISHELLEKVCQVTDGRPYYIGLWMDSEDFANGRIERPENLDGYFKKDFGAISPNARKLAQFTSILPGPLPDALDDYALVFRERPEELDGWVLELAQHRIFAEARDQPWFRHSLVHSYIRENQLSGPVSKSLAEQAVRALASKATERPSDYMSILAVLLPRTEDFEQSYAVNLQWAHQLISRSEYYSALASLERAERALQTSAPDEKHVPVLLRQAIIYFRWGEVSRSEEILLQAEAKAKPESAAASGVYHQMGIVKQQRGDYDGALELYQKSFAIIEQLGDLAGMSTSYHQMGMVKHDRGDYDGALELYQKSFAISGQLGDLAGMSKSYHQMGIVKHQRGDYDGALELYQKSFAISEQLGDLAGMSTSYHQMGIVKHDRGDYDGALELYQKSFAISEQLGDLAGMRRSLITLGLVLIAKGEHGKARHALQRSEAAFRQMGLAVPAVVQDALRQLDASNEE